MANDDWDSVGKVIPASENWDEVGKVIPTVSARQRTPGERFKDNFEEGQRSSLLGAGSQAAAVNIAQDGGYYKDRLKDEAESYKLRSEADPWHKAPGNVIDKGEAGLATLAGNLAGGALSPETLAGGPGKTWLGRAVIAGLVNMGVDVPVQALQNEAGTHEGFDAWRVVGAGVAGSALQGGGDLVVAGAKKAAPLVKEGARRAGEFFDNYGGKVEPAPRDLNFGEWDVVAPAGPAPKPQRVASVDDVWGNLTQQESGGRQIDASGQLIRSKKGAGGAAQLMPATAKEVAEKLGEPELADLAFQPTDAGRAANEKLGRAYYSDLLEKYGGDHELAAAAYNGGPGRVDRALKKFGREDVLAHLPQETQDYVRNVARGQADHATVADAATAPPELGARASDETADAIADAARSARNAARQAADEAVPEPNVTAEPQPSPDGHLDANHSRLYELGKKAEAGDVDLDAARDLGRDMAPFMDFTDVKDGWAKREKRVYRQTGEVAPQRIIEAARDYAAEFDTHGPAAKTSFYDPDKLHEAMAYTSRQPVEPAPIRTFQPGEQTPPVHLRPEQVRADLVNARPLTVEPAVRPEPISETLGLGRPAPRQFDPNAPAPRETIPADVLQSTRHGLSDQSHRVAVPQGQGVEFGGKSIGDMVGELRKTLGYTHRQGRMRGRKSLGEYSRQSGVVRTKSMRDIETAAHEAAHALEFTHRLPSLEAVMVKHATALKGLDYMPKLRRRHEGFAEWMRKYINNPAAADRDLPGFRADFEAALTKDSPKVLADLKNIRAWRENFLKTDSVSALKSTISEGGDSGVIADLARSLDERGVAKTAEAMAGDLYTASVDRLFPIQKGVRILDQAHLQNKGARLEIAAEDNPYMLARNLVDAEKAGIEDVVKGVVPYHGTASEGPSLRDALITAFGKDVTADHRSDFDSYLIARRLVHEWNRYLKGELQKEPHLIGKADLQQSIKDLEAKHPKLGDAAAQVYEWNQNKLRKTYEAGFISHDTYKKLTQKPDYVPLYRDLSDLKSADGRKVTAGADASAVPKTFRGSDRDIISPLTSMMEDARKLARKVRENDVKGAFARMADAVGPQGIDAVIERLPKTQLEAFKVNVRDAVEKKAKELGLSGDEADELLALNESAFGTDPMTTMFKSINLKPRQGERVIFHWKDGEVHPLQLPDGEFGKALYESLNSLNPEMQNVLIDLVAMGSAAVRMTATTLNPEFFAVNVIRDQLDAAIKTDVGYVPFVDVFRGLFHKLRNDDVAKRYRIAGGLENGTETVALGSRPQTMKDALDQKVALTKPFQFSPNPIRAMTALADLSESGTRLGIFAKAEKRALKHGASEFGAMTQAAFEARDYYDPQRKGSKTLTANRLVIFLNPYIQGWDKYLRVMTASGQEAASLQSLGKVLAPFGKNAPQTAAEKRALAHAYKAFIWTAGLATMGAGLTYLYANDLDYQKISAQTRATNWVFKAPGSDQWHRLPKQQEVAVFSNVAERWIEHKFASDPKAIGKMVSDLEYTMAPPHQIPLISIPLDLARNKNYAGRAIIPDSLRNVDPEYQYTAYTSKLARKVGVATGQSPIVLDYWVKGLFSSNARYGLQAADAVIDGVSGAPKVAGSPADALITRRFNVDPNRSTNEAKAFYGLAAKDDGKFAGKKATFDHIRLSSDGDAVAYLNTLKPDERAYVVATTFGDLIGDGGKNELGVKMPASMFHPIIRAQEALGVIAGVERDVRDATLSTMQGERIELTPEQRRAAMDALASLRVAEMRNALIATGQEGWRQKQFGDRVKAYDKLKAIDSRLPGLVKSLQDEQGIPRPDVAYRGWNTIRPIIEGQADTDLFDKTLMAKRLKSSDRKTKREALLQTSGAR